MKNQWLQFKDERIPYEVQHKKTLTSRIHLRATSDGSLLIVAPVGTRRQEIQEMLQARVSRVASFLVDANRKRLEAPQFNYTEGEVHWFLGQPCTLKLGPAPVRMQTVSLVDGVIHCQTRDQKPERIKLCLERWYRTQAADYFSGRIAALAERTSWVRETPPLRLRKMKRTWGSCSRKGVITLNTRLMRVPRDCVDYVIAHEFCHLKVMNHGPDFYALQEVVFPRWRETKAHLQQKAHVYLKE